MSYRSTVAGIMIDPDTDDVGRAVIYQKGWIDSDGDCNIQLEEGVITSFNNICVFVRYGSDKHSKGTRRQDLTWAQRKPHEI